VPVLGMLVGGFGCGGVVGMGVGCGVGVGVGMNSCLFIVISMGVGVGVGVMFSGNELLSNGCECASCLAVCVPQALTRIVIPRSTTRSHEFLNAKLKFLLIDMMINTLLPRKGLPGIA
jgi:hypothetical protein